MKKSQVLAAIALAFALGVVAPVAGVVNTASAITITEGGVVTANRQDVIDTVNAIEGQTEYKQYKALYDALNLQVNDAAVTDLTSASVTVGSTTYTISATNIKSLSAATDYAYKNYALLSTTDHTYAEIMQDAADTAKAAIAAASGKSYELWNNLYVAMNNTDTKNNSEDELAGAIVKAAEALGMTVKYNPAEDNLSGVKSEVLTTSYNENIAAANVSYASLIKKIHAYEDALEANTAKIDALKAALAPFANATAINDAVAFEEADGAAGYKPIEELTNLQSHATRYDNYAILIATVNGVNTALKTATSYTKDDANYNTTHNPLTVINGLKSEYKTAAGTDLVVAGTPSTDPTNPGVTIRTLTSENGEVTVTGAFPADVTLKVEPTTTDVFGNKTYEAYDITLMQGDKKFDFNGAAAVTIKVSKVDAAKSTVYYVDSENKAAALTSTYSGSYITFNTTHFSLYAVVEGADSDNKGDDNKTDDTTPGNTGAIASANGTASSTVAVVAGIATALTAAGAGVVAYRNARREA